MVFLAGSPTLLLDTLTIGPMGQTDLIDPGGAGRVDYEDLFHFLNVEPIVLRLDSYYIHPKSRVFSHRLTRLECFSVLATRESHDHIRIWSSILSSTPNLIHLALQCNTEYYAQRGPLPDITIRLPFLENLSLSGTFAWLATLISSAPLPRLNSVTLDVQAPLDPHTCIDRLAAAAPQMLSISVSFEFKGSPEELKSGWAQIFQRLLCLRYLAFFEMDHELVSSVLEAVELPATLTDLRLERMQFGSISWAPLIVKRPRTTFSFVGYDDALTMLNEDGDVFVVRAAQHDECYDPGMYPNVRVESDLAIVVCVTIYPSLSRPGLSSFCYREG
jgi:hypothetical protein